MRCTRAQQRLMAYHDSELSTGAGRRLKKHLESCDDCRRLLENLDRADHHASQADGINPVVGVPDMPPPDDRYWESFTARVLDRVEEEAATRTPERKRHRKGWDFFIPRMVPAFSIALVVVVAAGVLMKTGGPAEMMEAPVPSKKTALAEPARTIKAEEVEVAAARAPLKKAVPTVTEVKDDREQRAAAAVPVPVPSELSADPVAPGFTADTDLGNEMEVSGNIAPSVTEGPGPSALVVPEPPLKEPEKLAGEEVLDEMLDLSGDSAHAVSGIKALDSAEPAIEAGQPTRNRQRYRSPEDQLTHARRLAELRKFWESEQILKDLISQKPRNPIQEEASILLVRVLSSQNRVNAAQKTLDDAKMQFPENQTIQTFELDSEGGRPGN